MSGAYRHVRATCACVLNNCGGGPPVSIYLAVFVQLVSIFLPTQPSGCSIYQDHYSSGGGSGSAVFGLGSVGS